MDTLPTSSGPIGPPARFARSTACGANTVCGLRPWLRARISAGGVPVASIPELPTVVRLLFQVIYDLSIFLYKMSIGDFWILLDLYAIASYVLKFWTLNLA